MTLECADRRPAYSIARPVGQDEETSIRAAHKTERPTQSVLLSWRSWRSWLGEKRTGQGKGKCKLQTANCKLQTANCKMKEDQAQARPAALCQFSFCIFHFALFGLLPEPPLLHDRCRESGTLCAGRSARSKQPEGFRSAASLGTLRAARRSPTGSRAAGGRARSPRPSGWPVPCRRPSRGA